MKKQKLQNLLKFRILSFGILILLWNCQKDETTEHNHESSENTSSEIKGISINDLLINDNTSLNYRKLICQINLV